MNRRGQRSHGMSKHPLYNTWAGMMRRCNASNHVAYKYYGERGIKVCKRWQSVENFIADMGTKPIGKYTIERIDNEKGYFPENCKWATWSEQARNKNKRHLRARGISGVIGVYRHTAVANPWKAMIDMGEKTIHLGVFATIQEAAVARRQGEIKYWERKGR